MIGRRDFLAVAGGWLSLVLVGCRVDQVLAPVAGLRQQSQTSTADGQTVRQWLESRAEIALQSVEVLGRNGSLITWLAVNGYSYGSGDYRFYVDNHLPTGADISIDTVPFDHQKQRLRIERRFGSRYRTIYSFAPPSGGAGSSHLDVLEP